MRANVDLGGILPNHNIIGNNTNNFSGIFDGNTHEVKNFTHINTSLDYVGVFGQVSGTVHDLKITDVNISGRSNTGGLVGQFSGTINRIQVSGIVNGVGGTNHGGIAGSSTNTSSMNNITNFATLKSSGHYKGGIVGGPRGPIQNAYNFGNVYSSTGGSTGGIGGWRMEDLPHSDTSIILVM